MEMSGEQIVHGGGKSRHDDPWRLNEAARRRRLREDGSRPLAVNLLEGLALSEFLSTFTGSAQPPRDRDDVEALEAAQDDGDGEG